MPIVTNNWWNYNYVVHKCLEDILHNDPCVTAIFENCTRLKSACQNSLFDFDYSCYSGRNIMIVTAEAIRTFKIQLQQSILVCSERCLTYSVKWYIQVGTFNETFVDSLFDTFNNSGQQSF